MFENVTVFGATLTVTLSLFIASPVSLRTNFTSNVCLPVAEIVASLSTNTHLPYAFEGRVSEESLSEYSALTAESSGSASL